METPRRSFVKAVIWTLIGLITMAVVGVLMTGSLGTGGALALINSGLGILLYVVYERIWARIRWGRHG